MNPGRVHLVIPAGSKWEETVTWWSDREAGTPRPLTDWTAEIHVRRYPGGDLLLSFTMDDSGDGRIAIDGPSGTLTLTLPASATAGMNVPRAVYALELTNPSDADTPIRLLEGEVTISPEVVT